MEEERREKERREVPFSRGERNRYRTLVKSMRELETREMGEPGETSTDIDFVDAQKARNILKKRKDVRKMMKSKKGYYPYVVIDKEEGEGRGYRLEERETRRYMEGEIPEEIKKILGRIGKSFMNPNHESSVLKKELRPGKECEDELREALQKEDRKEKEKKIKEVQEKFNLSGKKVKNYKNTVAWGEVFRDMEKEELFDKEW